MSLIPGFNGKYFHPLEKNQDFVNSLCDSFQETFQACIKAATFTGDIYKT